MMPASRRLFLAVAALQVLVIAGLTTSRELALRSGTEVILETAPVDPTDLFRGDYVVLSYEISRIGVCEVPPGGTAYVPLREGPNGVWRAGPFGPGVALASFEDAAAETGVAIRGTVRSGRPFDRCRLDYGIESYFVPEGTGRAIERLREPFRVRVVIDADGDAVIKELILPEG